MTRRRPRVRGAVLAAWTAKARVARNSLGRAVKSSALRIGAIVLVASALVVAAFLVFTRVFAYLHGVEVVGPLLVGRILSLFFFLLFVMLVMSNVLVAFQSLYRSRETAFWMVSPLSPRQVFDARSLEIAAISSAAFLVLGAPLVLAFGVGTHARWMFYPLAPLLLLLFVALAHGLGCLAIVVLVRLFPGLDMKRLAIVIVAALVPVGATLVSAFRAGEATEDVAGAELVVHALEGLGRAQHPWLPGWWTSEALRAAASGDASRATFLAWTLGITALFATLLARAAAARWLLPGYQMLVGAAIDAPALSRRTKRGAGPARGPLRALARKDVALFLRDPAQWSQVGLVAVLAAVYVLNLRNLPDLSRFALWGSVASHLNLGVLLLLLATLSSRFAFPLVSLEGRRAWIVMLAPLPRRALLLQKMLLAAPLTLGFGLVATTASGVILAVSRHVLVVSFVAVVAGSFALTGLAVGLGALFPNFREDNPARVVSGFGGTLNFLLGLGYVAAMTVLLGAPSVLQALGRLDLSGRVRWEPPLLGAALLLSLGVGWVPLALGRRHLEQLEL